MNELIASDPAVQSVNSTVLIAIGIVIAIIAYSFKRDMLTHESSRRFLAALVAVFIALFTCGVCVIHHPEKHDTMYFVTATLSYLAIYSAEYLYFSYIVSCINDQRNNPIPRTEQIFTLVFCLCSAVIWALSIGNGQFLVPEGLESDYGIFFWIGHLGEWVMFISSALLFIWYRRLLVERQMLILFIVPLLMFIGTLLEPLTPGHILRYPFLALSLLIVFTQYFIRSSYTSSVGGSMGKDNRLKITTNRIKPHFVNNILSSIYYLCDMDIKRAQDVTMQFSRYMVGTLETIDNKNLVSFKRELETVKSYLDLETLRFEDRLNVEFEIGEEDFEIPPLILQSLVENSVKHGIAGKEDPSTLSITTRKLADGSIQIRVSDDGIGFDTSDPKNMNGELAYIKDVLDSELGGKISVKSKPGEGSTVTIKLPPPKKS